MTTFNKSFLAALAVFSLLFVSSSFAGVLDTNPNAIVSGSSPFTGANVNFFGTIDYAVFTAATWDSLFGDVINVPQGGGPPSAPHDPVGPFVYAYQINNLGSDAVSFDIQGNSQPITDIGYVDDSVNGTRAPTSAFIDAGLNANWSFIGNGILQNESSEFIVFSSKHKPIVTGTQILVNGGSTSVSFGVATPGPLFVPEPTSAALAIGFTALLGLYRRK